MAEAIKKKYGVSAELIESGGGVFEVRKDGKLIFSKKAIGRFPEEKEIFDKLD
ncbi:MAG: SelT/SelW/SelH family protein [candidate division Zixibacteria bacterium]|nr:SelT/SelW/SelH family protein [candidate division Zixibacteria bacterium]